MTGDEDSPAISHDGDRPGGAQAVAVDDLGSDLATQRS